MILLAIRNDRFRLAELVEHDHELAALDLLHLAREQIADARRELVADARALALANALDDALLRGLNGGAAELGEVDRLLEHVARLRSLRRRCARPRRRSRGSDPSPRPRRCAGAMILIVARPSSISTSACTVGPYLFARAARMPSCSSPCSSRSIELLRVRELFDRAQHVDGADHLGLPSLTSERQPSVLDVGQRDTLLDSLCGADDDAAPLRPILPRRGSRLRRDPGASG